MRHRYTTHHHQLHHPHHFSAHKHSTLDDTEYATDRSVNSAGSMSSQSSHTSSETTLRYFGPVIAAVFSSLRRGDDYEYEHDAYLQICEIDQPELNTNACRFEDWVYLDISPEDHILLPVNDVDARFLQNNAEIQHAHDLPKHTFSLHLGRIQTRMHENQFRHIRDLLEYERRYVRFDMYRLLVGKERPRMRIQEAMNKRDAGNFLIENIEPLSEVVPLRG